MWRRVGPYIVPLFDNPTPPSLTLVTILASSYVRPEYHWSYSHNERVAKISVAGWVAAVSAVPYSEEVGQSVVDVLLQIASIDSLRPRIPVCIWTWLKKQPSLPPQCQGRLMGTGELVVRHVRALGDVEILKSYLFLVWSEWDCTDQPFGGLAEMQKAIHEEFGEIGMGRYREDLIKRLDHILGQLDLGLEHLRQRKPRLEEYELQKAREQYGELKRVLLEVDEEVVNTLTRTSPRLSLFCLLTLAGTHRISLDLHVCSTSFVSVISHLRAWRSFLELVNRSVNRSPSLLLHFLTLSLSHLYGPNLPRHRCTTRVSLRAADRHRKSRCTSVIVMPLKFPSFVSQFHVELVELDVSLCFYFTDKTIYQMLNNGDTVSLKCHYLQGTLAHHRLPFDSGTETPVATVETSNDPFKTTYKPSPFVFNSRGAKWIHGRSGR